jgi:uncharacterized membrane protein YkvA (DUF1232 family)
MSDIDPRYLELFPSWLRTLGEDATAVGLALEGRREKDDFGRYLAAGLNYIFKSLDLIPDGIDDLGFLDDAFVLRVAAGFAIEKDRPTRSPEGTPPTPLDTVIRLADEAQHVKAFLEDDHVRLEAYVRGLRKGAARGRTVEDIVGDEATRTTFLQEVSAWGKAYQVPSFTRDIKTLIKLKAFLSAKLA